MPEIIEEVSESKLKDENIFSHFVTLFNDHHNTFDHVETCLMEICYMTMAQAQKTAMEAHTRGKAICYKGSLEVCETVAERLSAEDLTVSVS